MVNMVQKWNMRFGFRDANNREMRVVLALLRQSTHVRDLSKQTGIPHATVSRMLKGLGERNVVDFEVRGKNKVVKLRRNIEALNAVKMAEGYKLEKLIRMYPEMGVIIEEVLKRTKANLVVIFGSYAKFNAKLDSDIDLFVETQDRAVKKELEKINSRISVKIGRLRNKLSEPLVKEIIKDHVIVRGVDVFYEENQVFGGYEERR